MVSIKLNIICSFKIRIGDSNHTKDVNSTSTLVLDIIRSKIHMNYTKGTAYFDVAVLTTTNITFTKLIKPICLPDSASDDIHEYDYHHVDLTGWGKNFTTGIISKILRRVSINVFPLR